jgi:S-adenosylmethionine/arginine decarboxylase-like enzyme
MKNEDSAFRASEPLARQLLVDFYDCDRKIVSDPERIVTVISDACDIAREYFTRSVYRFEDPKGWAANADAEASYRTGVNEGFLGLELTFRKLHDSTKRKMLDSLKRGFGAKTYTVIETGRGFVRPPREPRQSPPQT